MVIELLTKRYPGMRQWLTQRLSAVIMVFYIVFLMIYTIVMSPDSYLTFQATFKPWWFRIALFLFFLCLCMHAWLGVRDVLRDYIFNVRLRAILQTCVDILLFAEVIWLGMILWNI